LNSPIAAGPNADLASEYLDPHSLLCEPRLGLRSTVHTLHRIRGPGAISPISQAWHPQSADASVSSYRGSRRPLHRQSRTEAPLLARFVRWENSPRRQKRFGIPGPPSFPDDTILIMFPERDYCIIQPHRLQGAFMRLSTEEVARFLTSAFRG